MLMNLTGRLALRKADEKTKDGVFYTEKDLRLLSSLSHMLYYDEDDKILYVIPDTEYFGWKYSS